MTPAERARQTDREEFAAECAAIRQRAYTRLEQLEHETRTQIAHWLGREIPVQSFNVKFQPRAPRSKPFAFCRPAVLHEAFGKAQSIEQWANEYGIAKGTIRTRLKLGWTLETALLKPPGEVGKRVHLPRPGVSSNFAPFEGTGVGSTLQASTNITFSGKAENA